MKLHNYLEYLLSIKRPAGGEGVRLATKFICGVIYNAGQTPLVDEHGNIICHTTFNRTIYSSHIDTVHWNEGVSEIHVDEFGMVTAWSKEAQQEQRPGMGLKPVREILGADDAAGIFIMLRMIENNIPGTYIFHADEEIGCVGSSALADGEYTIDGYDLLTDYDVAIAFDRRGTQDFIHRQLGQEMCSGAFQFELCKRLNTGTILNYRGAEGCITDTAMYADLVPECINLSVGYYDEHSEDERLDYGHLCALLLVILEDHKLFENLPVVRELPEPDGEFDWENDPDQYDAIDDWELPTNLPDLVRSFPDAVTDILEGMGYDYNEVLYTLDEMNQLP